MTALHNKLLTSFAEQILVEMRSAAPPRSHFAERLDGSFDCRDEAGVFICKIPSSGSVIRVDDDAAGIEKPISFHLEPGARLSLELSRSEAGFSSRDFEFVLSSGSELEFIDLGDLAEGSIHRLFAKVEMGPGSSAKIASRYCALEGSRLACGVSGIAGPQAFDSTYEQSCKVLNLGSGRRIVEPALRVSCESAKAEHGYAIGGPPPELLHFLSSRGFDGNEAASFIKEAHFADARRSLHV